MRVDHLIHVHSLELIWLRGWHGPWKTMFNPLVNRRCHPRRDYLHSLEAFTSWKSIPDHGRTWSWRVFGGRYPRHSDGRVRHPTSQGTAGHCPRRDVLAWKAKKEVVEDLPHPDLSNHPMKYIDRRNIPRRQNHFSYWLLFCPYILYLWTASW